MLDQVKCHPSPSVVGVKRDQSLANIVLVTALYVQKCRTACYGGHRWTFMSNICFLIKVSSIVSQLVQCGQIPIGGWHSGATLHAAEASQNKARPF